MIESLQSIRLRALALRSSVHNEHCLSAIELAGMVAKKTNEIIDLVNELTQIVEDHQDYLITVGYDPETEGLTIGGQQNE